MFFLETLPGWPEAPDVSVGFLLFLMVIAPLGVGLVVAVIAWVPKLSGRSTEQSAKELTR